MQVVIDYNSFFSNLPLLALSAKSVIGSYTSKSTWGPQKGYLSYFRKGGDIPFPLDRDEGLAH